MKDGGHHRGASSVGDPADGVFSERVLVMSRDPAETVGLRVGGAVVSPFVGIKHTIVGVVVFDPYAVGCAPGFEVNLGEQSLLNSGGALEVGLCDLGGSVDKDRHDHVGGQFPTFEGNTGMGRDHLINMNRITR